MSEDEYPAASANPWQRYAATGTWFVEVMSADHTTRKCPCGSSFTWSGYDPGLSPWVKEHEPHARPAPTIHLFRAATATALCGTTGTVEGVSCYPGDYPEMVRKLNPWARVCQRCLEVSRT